MQRVREQAGNFDINHPRPQLRRRRWRDLAGDWGFAHDDADIGVTERWFLSVEPFARTICVPFPPESRLSGIHDAGFHPVVWCIGAACG